MAAQRVLVVGGVAGGAACATRLRRLDEQAEIFIFERGGDVSFANCGLPYYVGGAIQDRKQLLIASPERFRDWFRIEVRTRSEVRAIDRSARTITVRNLQTQAETTEPYDALVLSPGAAPARPPIAGIDLPGVFTLRNLEDADRVLEWIRRQKANRAVVIGGGYIGLEMVENLCRFGMDVAVVEMLDQLMPPADPEMVAPIEAELRRRNVSLRLADGVAAIEQGGPFGLTVVTGRGERLPADIVIAATGVKPDVALARAAGLEIGALGGIVVDEHMRTSDPAIWAIGDAVEVDDFVTHQPVLVALAGPAVRQARIAADAICGRKSRYRGTQGTAVVGLFGFTLAMTGGSEKNLRRRGVPCEKVYVHAPDHAAYYPGAQTLALKLLFSPQDGRILGAQAVGHSGVEKRIDVLAMALQHGATVYDLEEAELCYAPQYGSAKDPVNMAGFVAANVLRGDVALAHWTELKVPSAAADGPLVLDVRNPTEVAAARVPGSTAIPLGELRQRIGELPRDREIWVHCAAGQRAYYACRILAQHGLQARNLSGGMKTFQSMKGD
jgi:NADPH-dependent 2,4-dienoyl-CoA reductase/sulfur reductase-like enzyme/rhodanese-related sulfurtransferase